MSKVLIVEDNDTFRHTLRSLLHSRFSAMAFEEARDGREALQKTNDFLPNLILMDIKPPGDSGLALTKQIKNKFPEIIIILLTNYDLPEYRMAAYESGADYFLGKGSSTAEEILRLVDSILVRMISGK
ncbi:MAG: response regulator transcription factor [Deltaproteobacteria bacterium]|nr:response regulator transcription factor [Deltaproteobacteria bacterium]